MDVIALSKANKALRNSAGLLVGRAATNKGLGTVTTATDIEGAAIRVKASDQPVIVRAGGGIMIGSASGGRPRIAIYEGATEREFFQGQAAAANGHVGIAPFAYVVEAGDTDRFFNLKLSLFAGGGTATLLGGFGETWIEAVTA